MIPLVVFYIHIVALAAVFTRRWQEEGTGEGILAVFFMALIFFVGWGISSFEKYYHAATGDAESDSNVSDVPRRLDQLQRILIEVLRLALTLGVEFAFPTRTIALDRRAGDPAAPDAAALAELVALAHGFGTAGPLARPQGLGAYVPAHEEAGPGPSSSGRTT